MVDVSIVIPAKNEAGNIGQLLRDIESACAPHAAFEIIVVDDKSEDETAAVVQDLAAQNPHLRLIRHDRSGGQSAAVHSGVRAAKAAIVCTLDGDGQNPPENLPKLFLPLLDPSNQAVGIVAGQRVGRRDTLSKRLASRFANGLRGWMLKDGTRDTGCGLKGFRREAFLGLPYFDHMHRYLIALVRREGGAVGFVPVNHRHRGAGASKYTNFSRLLVSMADLMGVRWLQRRHRGPARTEEL